MFGSKAGEKNHVYTKHRVSSSLTFLFLVFLFSWFVLVPTTHAISISDTVVVVDGPVAVRSPDACSSQITTKADGEHGTVLSGPTFCDGYNRWQIHWSDGIEGWSAEDFLQVIVVDEVPLPPTLIAPGSLTSPGPEISTLTPTMQWNAATGATGYGLYIRNLETNVLVYDNDFLPDSTSLTLPSGVLEWGHSYRWNMRARNGFGYSEFSMRFYFHTQNAVRIIRPNGGEMWPIGSIRKIRWHSQDGVGQFVRIELWRGGEYVATIKKHTPNDGKRRWTIS